MWDIAKMLIVLSLICAASGLVLSGLKVVTEEQIEMNVLKNEQEPAIRALFGAIDNDPVKERRKIEIEVPGKDGKPEKKMLTVFPGKKDGKLFAVALERPGKGGYGGDVNVIVAFDLKTDKIIGARVTTHSETPGLGSRAKSELGLVSQFAGRAPVEFKVKNEGGQIDAISGATKTSIGVCDGVTQAVNIYKKYKQQIIDKFK